MLRLLPRRLRRLQVELLRVVLLRVVCMRIGLQRVGAARTARGLPLPLLLLLLSLLMRAGAEPTLSCLGDGVCSTASAGVVAAGAGAGAERTLAPLLSFFSISFLSELATTFASI